MSLPPARMKRHRRAWWMLTQYLPGGLLLMNAAFTALDGDWKVSIGYALAAVVCWIAVRNILTFYRSGYWRGRADVYSELAGLHAHRSPFDGEPPSPWDPIVSMEDLRAAAQDAGLIPKDDNR